jgi:hypothetical protein
MPRLHLLQRSEYRRANDRPTAINRSDRPLCSLITKPLYLICGLIHDLENASQIVGAKVLISQLLNNFHVSLTQPPRCARGSPV